MDHGEFMADKEDVKIAILSFLIPLAGLYITILNRSKNPELSMFAQKWSMYGFFTALTAGFIGWMYYAIR
jgi:hypothetical protein